MPIGAKQVPKTSEVSQVQEQQGVVRMWSQARLGSAMQVEKGYSLLSSGHGRVGIWFTQGCPII